MLVCAEQIRGGLVEQECTVQSGCLCVLSAEQMQGGLLVQECI